MSNHRAPDDQHSLFFIPATTSLSERRPRTLKQDDTFAVFDQNGDALSWPGSPDGIYHLDTRHLSLLYLTICGLRPILLSCTLRDDNATLTCDLTNPDICDSDGRLVLEHDLVHLRRSRFLWNTTFFERLSVRNYDAIPQCIRLEIGFAADFVDLFEVRGMKRDRRGELHKPAVGMDSVRLSYTGLDGRNRATDIRFDPAPKRLTARKAEFELAIMPRESRSLFIEMRCGTAGQNEPGRRAFFSALRGVRRTVRAAQNAACSTSTSNQLFNETMRRSLSDIYVLTTDLPQGPYPYAGIPWFSTVFGRDALITAWQILWSHPHVARGVLGFLANRQAQEIDAFADAEPGKILHEMRHGEMAELGEIPFRRYYGSIDSTPLFILLAGAYLQRTGDIGSVRGWWPNVKAALNWIEEYGDLDGDGFVEYERRTPNGLLNQGWKDSTDSIVHADGSLAKAPIALAEVQAYVFGAYQAGAEIAQWLGHSMESVALARKAGDLRQKFDAAFFDHELGTYVLALDRNKRPCRVRSSNAGHALFTGLALDQRASSVVNTLMQPASFSGWGVRTLSDREARFNPMSYHNGSIWPHDNAMIAAGFARYGFKEAAAKIFTGLFEASTYFDLRRLPELFCGFARQRTQGPTPYPVACSPQAWAAAAPISLIGSCLGMGFNPLSAEILFDCPRLPAFIDTLCLRGLSLAGRRADIRLSRSGDQVLIDVLRREGTIKVITTK